MNYNHNTKTSQIILLLALLFFFIEAFFSMIILRSTQIKSIPFLAIVFRFPLVILSFLIFLIYHYLNQLELERQRQEAEIQQTRLQLEQSLQLIAGLQAQRHEYRNQLQVLQTLLALGKYEEMAGRINEYRLALDDLASLNKVENPILQALLLAAWTRAKEYDIDFRVDCRADLKAFSQPPVKVSRIFTNLLRNALEAAALRRGGAAVSVEIRQKERDFCFLICHNGPILPSDYRGRLFPPVEGGVTDEGVYGLSAAEALVAELGGRFETRVLEGQGAEFLVVLSEGPPPSSFGNEPWFKRKREGR